jgi:hypothetical protein
MTTNSAGPKRLPLYCNTLRSGGRQKLTTFDDILTTLVTTFDDTDDDIADDIRCANGAAVPESKRLRMIRAVT